MIETVLDTGAPTATQDHDRAFASSSWLRRPLRAYKWLLLILAVALLDAAIWIPLVMVLGQYLAALRMLPGQARVLAQTHAVAALSIAGTLALLLLLSVAGEVEYRRRARVRAKSARAASAASMASAGLTATAAAPVTAPLGEETHPVEVEHPTSFERPETLTKALAAAGRQSAAAARATPEGVVAWAGLPLAEPLLGRDSVVSEVLELMRAGHAVALAAPGNLPGMGRNAVAAEIAARLAPDVAWVDCDGLRGEQGTAALWSRVARAIGLAWVAESPDAEVRQATLRAAAASAGQADHALVLVHVEPELDVETLLDTLGAGQMKLLLTVGGPVDAPRVRTVEFGALAEDAAQHLLERQVSRLNRAEVGQDASTQDIGGSLTDLLPYLDGWPLAIRFAAPAIASSQKPWAEVVEAMREAAAGDDPLRRLRAHQAGAWQLATSQEQTLLAGLTLLAGETFPIEAAHAIARTTVAGTPVEQAAEAVDVLLGLALVEARSGGRLSLHPVVRQSAVERLSALDGALIDDLGAAMVAYWLEFAEGRSRAELQETLEGESAGLVGAIGWAHDHARHREVLSLAHALLPFWYAGGRQDDAGVALPWALDAAQQLDDAREIQFMQHEVALCLSQTGHTDEARAAFERALALARSRGSQRDELNELQGLGELESGARAWKAAREHFIAALQLAEALGDRREQRNAWHGLATLEAETGQLIVARERFEQALDVASLLADRRALRDDLFGLAGVEARIGHTEQAQRLYSEALELARASEDRWAIRESLHGLAQLEQRLETFSAAEGHLEEALQLARQIGDLALQSMEIQALGSLSLDLGDMDRARGHFQDALALARQINHTGLIADALWWTAALEERLGNRPAARDGYRAALELYDQIGSAKAKATRQRLSRLGSE